MQVMGKRVVLWDGCRFLPFLLLPSHFQAHKHRSEDLFPVALHVGLDAREQCGAHKVALFILGDLRGVEGAMEG